MDELQRHKLIFKIFRRPSEIVMRLKFRYTCDSLKGISGPYLLLCNHTTDLDPIFVGIAAHRQLYFVASDHVIRGGGIKSKALMRYFHPILHSKGDSGIGTAGAMLRCLKKGNCLCLFPEGNRSFDGVTMEIPPVTAKIARKSGASLVTCRLQGGYFTQPRWSKSFRKGKVQLRVMHVLRPEELSQMPVEQLQNLIEEDLHEDAYHSAFPKIPFKGKNRAVGLESALYSCPKCHQFLTLSTVNFQIHCSSCGWNAKYDEFGYLQSGDETWSISECSALQKKCLAERFRDLKEGNILLSESVLCSEIGSDGKCCESRPYSVSLRKEGFYAENTLISYSEITGISVYGRNRLCIFLNDKRYEVCGDAVSFNALKYYDLYKIIKNKE